MLASASLTPLSPPSLSLGGGACSPLLSEREPLSLPPPRPSRGGGGLCSPLRGRSPPRVPALLPPLPPPAWGGGRGPRAGLWDSLSLGGGGGGGPPAGGAPLLLPFLSPFFSAPPLRVSPPRRADLGGGGGSPPPLPPHFLINRFFRFEIPFTRTSPSTHPLHPPSPSLLASPPRPPRSPGGGGGGGGLSRPGALLLRLPPLGASYSPLLPEKYLPALSLLPPPVPYPPILFTLPFFSSRPNFFIFFFPPSLSFPALSSWQSCSLISQVLCK